MKYIRKNKPDLIQLIQITKGQIYPLLLSSHYHNGKNKQDLKEQIISQAIKQ